MVEPASQNLEERNHRNQVLSSITHHFMYKYRNVDLSKVFKINVGSKLALSWWPYYPPIQSETKLKNKFYQL